MRNLRAAEIASHDRVKEVTVDCVHRAIQESFQSSHLRQLQGSSMGEKFFLAALCLDLRASGLPESDILSVYRRLKEIQTLNNEEVRPWRLRPYEFTKTLITDLVHHRLFPCLQ